MRWLAMVALVAACSFRHGVLEAGGGGGDDASGSDAHRGSDGTQAICYGTGLGVQVCPASPPSSTLSLSGSQTVHTDPGSSDCAALVGPTANDYCALVATDVAIAGTLTGTGSRPLVIVSTGSIAVSGIIDVSSHIGGNRGAGANTSPCGGTDASSSTGGGAGGSLGTAGGNGGSSPGGVAGLAIDATTLRGGCPGTLGKDYFDGLSGPPGDGGGAVDLIAVGTVTISGIIDASGGGGFGALPTRNGGQGGGSGGMIVLDAPSVKFSGSPQLFANGGGGGGGSNGVLLPAGNGSDPTGPGAGGAGGTGQAQSGNGGVGGSGTGSGQPGTDATMGNGNGGGGGGVGIIRVFQSSAPTGGAVSPPFS